MRVSDYLGYLRDMSRKISFRGGFENCLNRTISAGVPSIYGLGLSKYAGLSQETWLDQARQKIDKEENLGVYLGYGIVAGKITLEGKQREVAGPLIIMPIDIETNEVGEIEFEHEDTLLNYDLLAMLIPGADTVSDAAAQNESPVLFTKELLRAINEAESFIEAATMKSVPSDWAPLVKAVYDILSPQIPALSHLQFEQRDCPSPSQIKLTAGAAQGQVVNCQFLFVGVKPSEVTTYQALTKLIKQTNGEHGGEGVQNPVLAKLLLSSIEQTNVDISRDDNERSRIYNSVVPLIPMSLSEPQKQAIADAWASEISYVQGPPGTGKSHTITAMIVSAILLGKKVLLVSNKKAALSVVQEKVDKILGPGALSLAVADTEGRKQQKAQIDELIARADHVGVTKVFNDLNVRVERLRKQVEQSLAEIYAHEDTIDFYLQGTIRSAEALNRLISLRDFYTQNYQKTDFEDQSLSGKTVIDDEYLHLIEQVAQTIEQSRMKGAGLSKFKALKLRTLLSFTAHELGGKWILSENQKADIIRKVDAYVKTLHAAHDLFQSDSCLDPRIAELRKLLSVKRANYDQLSNELVKTQLEMVRISKANEHLADLQQFKQVFFFRKPSRLQSIFARTKVADALKALPIWAAEIKDLSTVFPFELGLFDLVLVDEASQVNIAELIPAFYRGTRFCVVGDDRQLGLGAAGLFALNRNFERLSWERHCETVSYETAKTRSILVTEHSILDLILRSPYSAQLPQVMLDEHFRSRPTLAGFTSEEVYSDGGGLKVMTETAKNLGKGTFKVEITGGVRRPKAGIVDEEVDRVIKILTDIENGTAFVPGGLLVGQKTNQPLSVGVVSFTRDQVDEIRSQTMGRFKALDLIVGTPEEMQGNERDIILLTFGLGVGTRYAKGHYENPNRFNVATSRARLFTVAILGEEPKNAERLKRYLNLNDSTAGAFSFPKFNPNTIIGEAKNFLATELSRYIQLRTPGQGESGITLHSWVRACGQEKMDFVLINPVRGKGVHVEIDGSPGYTLNNHYPFLQRDRVAVLSRAGYGIIHLRLSDLYEHGWIKRDESLQNFRRRLDAQLDEYLISS